MRQTMGLSIDGEPRIGLPMPRQSVRRYRGRCVKVTRPLAQTLETGAPIRPSSAALDYRGLFKRTTLEGRS